MNETFAASLRNRRAQQCPQAVRRQLGYEQAAVSKAFVNSLLELARRIEGLAPALAGLTPPNPEYPWRDAGSDAIRVPAMFAFIEFDRQTNLQMAKLHRLVRILLRIAR